MSDALINVFQPALGAEELDAVRAVFASNWVGKGAVTASFEAEFADRMGEPRDRFRSASCATEALFQALPLAGIGPGDDVVLPAISFVGAGNAVMAAGARPVFCDVDPRTLNATPACVAAALTPRSKAVLVLHYGGVPCEMDELLALAKERGLALIEDSACSVASRYRGRACGCLGDVGAWSFDAMKILVTGDGGMIYCRDPERAARAEEGLYLGLGSRSGFSRMSEQRWWEFQVSTPGRRAIMNDIASAIGLEQLKKLSRFVLRRREIHRAYQEAFADLAWLRTPPEPPAHVESSYYFYWVQTPPGSRDRLAQHMKEQGVYTTFRYYPLHRVRLYGSEARLPAADAAAETTLCLPLHQSLSDDDVSKVVAAVRAFRA